MLWPPQPQLLSLPPPSLSASFCGILICVYLADVNAALALSHILFEGLAEAVSDRCKSVGELVSKVDAWAEQYMKNTPSVRALPSELNWSESGTMVGL